MITKHSPALTFRSRIILQGIGNNNDYPVQAYVVDFREGMVPVGIESIADHNQPGNNPGTSHIYPNPASEYIFIPDQYINFITGSYP